MICSSLSLNFARTIPLSRFVVLLSADVILSFTLLPNLPDHGTQVTGCQFHGVLCRSSLSSQFLFDIYNTEVQIQCFWQTQTTESICEIHHATLPHNIYPSAICVYYLQSCQALAYIIWSLLRAASANHTVICFFVVNSFPLIIFKYSLSHHLLANFMIRFSVSNQYISYTLAALRPYTISF